MKAHLFLLVAAAACVSISSTEAAGPGPIVEGMNSNYANVFTAAFGCTDENRIALNQGISTTRGNVHGSFESTLGQVNCSPNPQSMHGCHCPSLTMGGTSPAPQNGRKRFQIIVVGQHHAADVTHPNGRVSCRYKLVNQETREKSSACGPHAIAFLETGSNIRKAMLRRKVLQHGDCAS